MIFSSPRQTSDDAELGSASIAIDEEAVLASLDNISPIQRYETWKWAQARTALPEAEILSSHARDAEVNLSSEPRDMVSIGKTGLPLS